ncbi:sigma-E processing peptidase SpoIIGA [Anaerobacillus sp. HL2]|nr:sigma-E processing peptidase SpoIIGA [Anaerobacillus sp. HL2]
MVDVEIVINETFITLKGLIDSGNQLHDPLTKKPVMIIDMNNYNNKFPKNIVHIAKNPEMIGDPSYVIEEEWGSKALYHTLSRCWSSKSVYYRIKSQIK